VIGWCPRVTILLLLADKKTDLKPSKVEDELKESEHRNIEIGGIVNFQVLSSHQAGYEESENGYRDDLQQISTKTHQIMKIVYSPYMVENIK